jgi:hypothetical protein
MSQKEFSKYVPFNLGEKKVENQGKQGWSLYFVLKLIMYRLRMKNRQA